MLPCIQKLIRRRTGSPEGFWSGRLNSNQRHPGAKIAFYSNRDSNYEIYVMNDDGSGLTRLTNNADADLHPIWSPDGARIAFHSNRDGNYEIYVMNADGTGVTRITTNSAGDWGAVWSPAVFPL